MHDAGQPKPALCDSLEEREKVQDGGDTCMPKACSY